METTWLSSGYKALGFQKPTFEWVWRLVVFIGYYIVLWFQKPTFEWVWRLRKDVKAGRTQVSEAHI